MIASVLFTLAVTARADSRSLCERHLAGTGDVWAALEARYLEIRSTTPFIQADTPENHEVNDLLGQGFEKILAGLDRYLVDLPTSEIHDVEASLARDFVQSDELPYLHPGTFPSIARLRAVIDEINSARRFPEKNIYSRPEGGTLVVEGPFIDQYVRYYRGLDTDPFVIEDEFWITLLSESVPKFKTAFAMYRDLRASRAEIDAELNPKCARMARVDERVRRTLDLINRLARPSRADVFEKQLADFDLSSVSESRRQVDGTFFALPLPVGAHGTKLNRRLRRTVQVLTLLLERDAREELRAIERRAPQLLARETTRGRNTTPNPFSSGGLETDPALNAVVEGHYTIAQALNFLLVDEIPGQSDMVQLVRELTTPSAQSPSAIALMTLYLRMGALGPATLSGNRFPHPLGRDADGHLNLSRALKADLSARIAESLSQFKQRTSGEHNNHRKSIACPIARDLGIQAASDSFRRVFETIGD